MRLILLGIVVALSGCIRRVPLPAEAEEHFATTDDGWRIHLVRYRPTGTPTGRPVVLCHGISANSRNVDLDEGHSMARWFAAQGREAWTISLRGTGASEKKSAHIDFEDYWRHDLPAVLAEVRRATGATDVDYVGHSMGGMIMYAYLSQRGAGLHAVATLGTPTRLDWGTVLESTLGSAVAGLLKTDTILPSEAGAAFAAPLQGIVEDGPFQRFLYNPESTKVETWQRLMVYGVADTSANVLQLLQRNAREGAFRSTDRTIDYRADMASITTPVLVVAAKLDRTALAPGVKDGFRALGGPKEWLLITRANGSAGEYGHMDLVIGERAADEVWRKLLDFFNRNDSTEKELH